MLGYRSFLNYNSAIRSLIWVSTASSLRYSFPSVAIIKSRRTEAERVRACVRVYVSRAQWKTSQKEWTPLTWAETPTRRTGSKSPTPRNLYSSTSISLRFSLSFPPSWAYVVLYLCFRYLMRLLNLYNWVLSNLGIIVLLVNICYFFFFC